MNPELLQILQTPCDWKGCTKAASHEIYFTQQGDIRKFVCLEHLDCAETTGFWEETIESRTS